MRRSKVFVAAILLVTACAAGCGHGGSPPAPVIDLAALDFGPYQAAPHDMGKPKNSYQARVFEAERLGDTVPLAMDIDPSLTFGGNSGSLVFEDPKNTMLHNFGDFDNFAQDAPNFIGGYISYGMDSRKNDGIELLNAVMLFPDEKQAADAAAALEHRDFTAKPDNQPVPIPKYPAAHAHWEPGNQSIDSWYATGKILVFTSDYDHTKIWFHHTDLPALVTMVTKSLDTIVPAVAKFTPTPANQLSDKPMDIDGMLGRTMIRPQAATGEWLNPPVVFHAHAALGWTTDPIADQRNFRKDGVDLYAEYGNTLYRARDAAGAQDIRDQLGDPSKHFKSAAPPRNLPVAKCRQYHGPVTIAVHFYCSVAYGRYASQSWGEQLLDAQQRISAQYAILVRAK
ncbi:DUF7373 family lipoprotein [Nocardia miyunensis]|uniref:DUF7373 family lipoprotein n=1 Tax=Nocardia miyunensis TaxID=282684 RepID=UPI000831CBE5|nr:hypothetical protein [Nocardia miyunensis]